MTIRAFIIGLLGAASICGVVYFNDFVMRQSLLVSHYLPASVFGGLIFFLLVVNPILRRLHTPLALRGAELAVITGMTLVACGIPSSGLMRNFVATLMMPHKFVQTEAGWQEAELLEYAPDKLLADPTVDEGQSLDGMLQGLGIGRQGIGLDDIPWAAWQETLSFWLPLVMLMFLATLGLSLVVHQQWSKHEFLPYPIVQVIDGIFPRGDNREGSPIFRNNLFWIALAIPLIYHLNNYLFQWFPAMIEFPRALDFTALRTLLPPEYQFEQGLFVLNMRLFFSAIAIAFFLPKEISLSVAIGPPLFALATGFLASYGINIKAGGIYAPAVFAQVGAYFGIALMVVYTGRYFYWRVFSGALGHKNKAEVPGFSIWGARLFLLSTVAFVILLSTLGLDWQLSVFFTICLLVTFLALSRIVAETGVFALQIMWFPAALLVGILGVQNVGPAAVLVISVATMIFISDPRESVMPFVVNALRLADVRRVSPGKTGSGLAAALVVALLVAIPVTFFWIYSGGSQNMSDWSLTQAGKEPLNQALQVQQRLMTQGALEAAEQVSGFGRLTDMAPNWGILSAFGIGLGLVVLFSFLRLRFNGFPLHPVLFAVIMGWPTLMMAGSFLLGWFTKLVTMKYGGEKAFQQLKPFMIGLLGGEVLAGFLIAIFSLTYYVIAYWITGQAPTMVFYEVMPG